MSIKIALAGNPNSGKTTLFNVLTGSNQFVGNWPGVTVEKKEGKLKKNNDVIITDLPGIYSLSPYTLEEVIARNYLIEERPDVILNIVDGTNLERNLYLTTQLIEVGIPVVIAINMMDVMINKGHEINIEELSKNLGCRVVEISALKNKGIKEVVAEAIKATRKTKKSLQPKFDTSIERAIMRIEETVLIDVPMEYKRWYAIKVFERDKKILSKLNIKNNELEFIEAYIKKVEKEANDEAESIIINERYSYITSIIEKCYKKKKVEKLSTSDKIDKILTNKFLALPIFAIIMFLVYFISVTTVGTWATDWTNDGIFGEGWHLFGIKSIWIPGIPVIVEAGLNLLNCSDWLKSLILDGIIGGVGAVIGFVPQMLVLFLFLAFLEGCGYMTRVAFIMDKIFRGFGLSGKSFIPLLIGTGCSVPGIMASRTIENNRDRKITIITTSFIPCSAKLPIIALISGTLFGGNWWVAPSAYFLGILAIIISGIILKKTKLFAGDIAPFIMELPEYHLPTIGNLFHSMWERGWSFIKKAGTIILLSTIVLWFLQGFGIENGSFGMVSNLDNSILASIGGAIAIIFSPLGWGNWQSAVATITGLIAKENVVSTFGVLFGGLDSVAENGFKIWDNIKGIFTPLAAYSFLVFNLLCAPCFAAIGAIRREMNNRKWTWFAIGYQCLFAYVVSFIIYQLGMFFTGNGNIIGTMLAFIVVAVMLLLLFRPYKIKED